MRNFLPAVARQTIEKWAGAVNGGPGPAPFSVNTRLIFFGCVIFCGLGILLAKLYYEQIVRHEYWTAKISTGSEMTVRIPALRGEIRDRNGARLAENGVNYAIEKGVVPKLEELGLAAKAAAAGSFAQVDAVDYKQVVVPVVTSSGSRAAVANIPVGMAVPFDSSDDPETLDSIDAPPRAIPVDSPHLRRPDIRPAADARGRVLPHLFATPAPAQDNSHIIKPFFNPER